MNTANIIRPELTANFTALPNQLLGFGRHLQGLKPRDSAVLNYLLSKPSHWKIRAADIARAVNISINTVYAALTKLQKLGIASFTRDKFGHTHWVISLHTTLSSPVATPHTKKPREEFCEVLANNQSLEKKKKTTASSADFEVESPPIFTQKEAESSATIAENNTSSCEEVEKSITLPEQLSEIEKQVAKKSIQKAKLDNVAYSVVLMALKTALSAGNVRSPIAYLNGLINKAKDGSLDVSQYRDHQAPINRREAITQLFTKHGEKIRLDIVTNGMIKMDSLGYVTYDEVKQLGLLENKWIAQYNALQMAKMAQLSEVKASSSSSPTAQPTKTVTMNETDFEASRQAKLAQAMALLEKQNGSA